MNSHAELKSYVRNILLSIKTTSLSLMSWRNIHFQVKPQDNIPLRYVWLLLQKVKAKVVGARVITYNLQRKNEDEIDITLMTIYDKSEISNVSNAYLRSLISQLERDKK